MDAYELEKRYVRQDGALVWAHLTVSLVRTPEGAPANTIQMVQDITERKRLEQDHARLLGQERAARLEAEATRVEAEATNAQLQAMQALTDTALSHLALDDLLRELLGRVTAVLGVDNVAILLLDENDQTLTVRAARGPEEEAIGRTHIPVGQGFSGRIAASKEPLIVDDLATFEAGRPLLGPKLRAVVGVPLLMEEQMAGQPAVDRLVGVLHVGSVAPRRFTAADVELLERDRQRPRRPSGNRARAPLRRRAERPAAGGGGAGPGARERDRGDRSRPAPADHPGDDGRWGGRVRCAGPPRPDESRLPRALRPGARASGIRVPVSPRSRPPAAPARRRHRCAAPFRACPYRPRAARGARHRAGGGLALADVRRPRAGGERQRRTDAGAGRTYRRHHVSAARS